MTDVERLNAMQDHVHDGDDVGEGLLLLAVEGALLQSSSPTTPPANASASPGHHGLHCFLILR